MYKKHPKKAFTLAESLIVLILIGILASVLTINIKPGSIKESALITSGANMYTQLDFVFKNILAKKSKDYSMLNLIATDNSSFSIVDSGADAKLLALIKKSSGVLRKTDIDASYLALKIVEHDLVGPTKVVDETTTNMVISDFPIYTTFKNDAFIGIKLNGNCSTTENAIYNPQTKQNRNASNSCGLLFFDVNGKTGPNVLLVDQYIVSIGKRGLK